MLEEMKFFPKGRYDDGLDALQMVYEISRNVTGGCIGYPVGYHLNTCKSNVLDGIPDLRSKLIPHVYNNREGKDRFVPDPNDY